MKRIQFGNYTLHKRIGMGGMAEIFLATTEVHGLSKRLVLKRILPTLSNDEQLIHMLIEEARLCANLKHPNLVEVYDLDQTEDLYYITMEFVEGKDLRKTLSSCANKKVGFPTTIALYIIIEILKGLHYAHTQKHPDGSNLGIVHRDVSPSNIFLAYNGAVKLGDFGIAKAANRKATASGVLKGKFGYLAPEQVTGAKLDQRADIFATGIVLYELLTGRRLYSADSDLLALTQVQEATIDPPLEKVRPDLSKALVDIVKKALSKAPEDRFQTAKQLHDELFEYVTTVKAVASAKDLTLLMSQLFPDESPHKIEISTDNDDKTQASHVLPEELSQNNDTVLAQPYDSDSNPLVIEQPRTEHILDPSEQVEPQQEAASASIPAIQINPSNNMNSVQPPNSLFSRLPKPKPANLPVLTPASEPQTTSSPTRKTIKDIIEGMDRWRFIALCIGVITLVMGILVGVFVASTTPSPQQAPPTTMAEAAAEIPTKSVQNFANLKVTPDANSGLVYVHCPSPAIMTIAGVGHFPIPAGGYEFSLKQSRYLVKLTLDGEELKPKRINVRKRLVEITCP